MNDFKEGDVVQLKSGGPEMTIEEIIHVAESGEYVAICKWFDVNEIKKEVFHLSSIKYPDEK